ncbi:MAG: tetratricopeptide repeat protein [Chloroflexi bacterium]|nr:tetratricopeptide repeat protein [Chloroflexota bacterium]
MNPSQPVLRIDLNSLEVHKGGEIIRLSRTEWNLLRVLIEHKNQPLSHEFLLQTVWGDGYGKESNYLHSFVGQLRKKLGVGTGDPQYIMTLPRVGYKWVEQADSEVHPQFAAARQPDRRSLLPAALTSFIGRERERGLLERMLRKRDIRLISLTGPGGIGKTRLSLEVAEHLANDQFFADGIHFIALETIDTADLVVGTIARTFGIREKLGEDVLSSLKRHLRDKDLLLILDNFERVHSAAEHILEILKAASSVKVLVTSQEKLNLYGEHNFEVPPLSLASDPDIAGDENVALSEAVQLFVDRAQAVHPYFEITADNVAIVQQLCDRLDGLPLAIELAAVQSKRFAPQELLAKLDSQLSVLVDGQSNLPPRHQTLRAAIDWSYQLLDTQERKLFVALSIFNGSFSPSTAAAVCASDANQAARVPQKLLSLQDKSLLTSQSDDVYGETRYTMLGSFREFAGQLLGRRETEELGRRHADYYVGLLEQTNHVPPDQRMGWLARDVGNFRAALRWALTNRAGETALRLAVGMYELWQHMGMLREGKQWLFDALDATQHLTTPLRARALYCAAALADWLGEYQIVQSLYRESLRLYEASGDAAGVSSALLVLASALINQGDFVEGRELSEQALRVAHDNQNPSGIAFALNNLGMVATYQGDALKAREYYQEMLSLWQSLNYSQGTAWALTGLSWAELLHGNYSEAQKHIDRSLELHRQSGDLLSSALALACDGWIALYTADVDAAVQKLSNCLALCRELGLVNLSVWPLVGLGRSALFLGNPAQARHWCEEALRLCKDLNFPPMTPWVYIAFGKLYRLERDVESAFDYLDRALTLSHKRGDNNALTAALEEFAAHFADQGHVKLAVQLYGFADQSRVTHGLPLSLIDRAEYDEVTTALRANKHADWNANWQVGRSLRWSDVTALIYDRRIGFDQGIGQ